MNTVKKVHVNLQFPHENTTIFACLFILNCLAASFFLFLVLSIAVYILYSQVVQTVNKVLKEKHNNLSMV